MDQRFFAQMRNLHLQVWHTDGKRLEVTADNHLATLTLLAAPKLNNLVLHPNSHLRLLIICFCPLTGLTEQIINLQELNVLKIENCRLSGTFNLAELVVLQNLTTFSLEANKLTEVILRLDATTDGMESKLVILNLSSNRIKHFNLDVLRSFPAIKELHLFRNSLVTIDGTVYLPVLNTLDVRENLLTELDLSGCACGALVNVYALYNNLTSFPVFNESTVNIKVLDLSNNRLTTVSGKELQKQQQLTSLLLSSNALRHFTTDDDDDVGSDLEIELPSLDMLALQSNRLESLDLRGWKLPMLHTLHVILNPLKSIPDNLHERYPKLNKLICFCPDIECGWIQRNVQHVQQGSYEMSVARGRPGAVGSSHRCVTVPYVGCVRCAANQTKPKEE
uniref:LRRCT domain-containing protein n=1 Tax=Anopheles epiroticus TaxID=199890 RepID=A0A182PQH1_9DIPT